MYMNVLQALAQLNYFVNNNQFVVEDKSGEIIVVKIKEEKSHYVLSGEIPLEDNEKLAARIVAMVFSKLCVILEERNNYLKFDIFLELEGNNARRIEYICLDCIKELRTLIFHYKNMSLDYENRLNNLKCSCLKW